MPASILPEITFEEELDQKLCEPQPQSGFLTPLAVSFKISDDHPVNFIWEFPAPPSQV